MGYIPSILALLGFCFLFGIVNFNTIKVKRDLIIKKLRNIKEDVEERNRIIQALLNEVTPASLDNLNVHYFEELISINYSLYDNFYSKEKKAQQWVNELLAHLKANGYPDQNTQLLNNANEGIALQLQNYRRDAKEYNKLIKSKPTSFIAKLFNFREVSGI